MLRIRTEIYGAVDMQINSKRCYVTHRKYVFKNPMGKKKLHDSLKHTRMKTHRIVNTQINDKRLEKFKKFGVE